MRPLLSHSIRRSGTRRLPLVALALVALASCSEPPPQNPWSRERIGAMPLRHKLAQMLVVRVSVPAAGLPAALADTPRVGGVEVVSGSAERAAVLLDSLRSGWPQPPIVMARLERGVGAVLAGGTEIPASAELGTAVINTRAAQAVAAEARAVGIDLAIVPGPRLPAAAGGIPGDVAATGGPAATAAFLRDLRAAGLPAVVTALDPPRRAAGPEAPILRWDRAALDAGGLASLRSAVRDSVMGVQLGWVALPSLTGDSVPLPLSPVAAAGVVRRDLAFDGLLVADVGPGSPLRARFGAAAPVAAVAGGAELLLGVDDPAAALRALAGGVERGELSAARVDEAVQRIFAAKERAGVGRPRADSLSAVRAALRGTEALGLAQELHTRAVNVAGTPPATLLRGCAQTVVVLPPRVVLPEFTAELSRRVRGLAALGTPWVARRGPLSALPQWPANGAPCVIAVALPGAAPRVVDRLPGIAADTAPRDSAAAPADTASRRIVYVTFLPSAGDSIPAVPTAVLAWGTGPEAQRAAARAVTGALVREEAAPRPLAWPAARTLQRTTPKDAGMSADSLARIDRVIRKGIADGVFTSAAVAVGRRGKLVKLTGYGQTGGRPVDPEITLFDLASLTKVVGTTAAAMALVDDRQLPLDAPVRRYVPLFRGGEKGSVTIRHLLTHTSGLPAGADLYSGTRDPEAALRRVFRSSLQSSPGEKMEYSDFGMITMAEVVRRRAEVPVDQFLARRVFGPLGMQSTQYDPPVALVQPITVPTALRSERPYTIDGVVHDANAFRLGGVTGHAGLFSTARDVAVYAQTLLNGGAYGARRVWSPRTVRIFAASQGLPGNRGLGWDKPAPRSSAGDYISSSSFGHLGFTGTSVWIDPQRDLFVIILTNRTFDRGNSGQIYAVRQSVNTAAVRAIADVTITPRPGTVAAQPKPKPKPKAKPRPRPRRPQGRRG